MLDRLAATILLCGGLMTQSVGAARAPMPQRLQGLGSSRQPATINEGFERKLLKETHGRGTFVEIHSGTGDGVTTIFVHGMRGSTSSLARVILKAGDTVKAFVYDDKFRSLEDSSGDLATSIETWMDDNPEEPLRLVAHSMGGRVALGALAILQGDGRLTSDVELNLIASPIAGVKSATFSRAAPGFIPWIRPSRGMASGSKFQGVIDRLELPSNVTVNIFVGGKDDVFSHSTKKHAVLVARLHASLTVFANATHTSILDDVARLPVAFPASRARSEPAMTASSRAAGEETGGH
jgi:hypothetical protein